MPRAISPDVPFALIQSIRAVHSLMECDYDVLIPPEHEEKFRILKARFGARYTVSPERAPRLPILVVHSEPRTSIGNVERPLLFPHVILDHCLALWQSRRTARFSFAGLLTEEREHVLGAWITRSFPDTVFSLPPSDRATHGWARSLLGRITGTAHTPRSSATPRSVRRSFGPVVFWSSRRGRHFPIKSWDDEYFALLAASQFVLCPNGDFVWSYRFFEAIMCGAIPIVEETCPAYDGFRFRTMGAEASGLEWSEEDARHNYALCRARLTAQTAALNAEIERMTA